MDRDQNGKITLLSPEKVEYIRKKENSAAGRIIITPARQASRDLEYTAYFGNANGVLEGYTHAAFFPAGTLEKEIAENTVLPCSTTKMYVFASHGEEHGQNPYVLDIRPEAEEYKEPLWKFWIITDLHACSVQETEEKKDKAYQNENSRKMFADISALVRSDPVCHKAIITVGDNTDGGREDQWQALYDIQKEFLTEPVSIRWTLGNHELCLEDYDLTVENFLRYTGMPGPYYCDEMEGILFVHLGPVSLMNTVDPGMDIDEKEQAWMTDILEKARRNNKLAFVFLHTPLLDTVSGSLKTLANQNWGGHVRQNDQLRKLFARYPNVILFTGHTHWKFDSLIPVVDGKGLDASFVNCASVGYLWNDDDQWDNGSEGFCVDVYSDHIELRGREFSQSKWVSYAEFRLPFYF